MLYTITASLPLLFALMIIHAISHHTSIILPFWVLLSNTTLCQLWWAVTIIAFLVKTPIFLTHLWLPKAHVEAPVAGSMILAGILLKLGGYGLLRISSPLFHHNAKISFVIMRISLVGAVIARFICVRQTDVKSLIAYSSVSHMGIVTAGVISNTS
jgi:NADH-ubiquinone oxidoreductase chain 4